ncbi:MULTISPECIES: hypothetical protein [Streptomyces]|uniref:hypothetical protein n=1 Tax=Streptomyces rutgersensis TaxID=53451 RepID=UPI0013C74205|nr:hypothetical protein [Streptomyces rutgersensis]GFH67995.1 hypothetical protein Srut_45090 [Streptomyces rutgersensis]
MPLTPPLPRSDRDGPRRRTVLTGAVTGAVSAALLTGCSAGSASGDGAAERARTAAPRLLAAARAGSERLLARYDAVITAHPELAGRLAPLREQVATHRDAFTSGPAEEVPPNAAPPAPAPQSTPHAAADADDAVRGLADAERELAARRGKDLLEAPGELARLLASAAAAGAAHAYLLTEGKK